MDEHASDSQDQILTRERLETWTKAELSKWLTEKGLKKGGMKNALINRVCSTFDKQEMSSDTTLGTGSHTNQKYCCVPLCHNTSQTVLPDGQKVSLHRLPVDQKRKRQWIVKLNHVRKNLLVTEGTRGCMVHFENYDTSNFPTIFPTKQPKVVKPRRPLQRITSKATSQTKDMIHVSELPEDANRAAASPVLCAKCHNKITDKADVGTQCTPDTKSAETQSSIPDIVMEDLHNKEKKVRFYTGFNSFQMLVAMFRNLIVHGADRLNYWRGEKSFGERVYHDGNQKTGPKRSLRFEDEFMMTCMRLRLGLMQEHLADIFKVSESTVSRVLNTWINFIYDASHKLIPWPTTEQILYNLPRAFLDFHNTQIVLDCTEIFVEKPSSYKAQFQTWSDYKSHNTVKLLVGVSPNGTVIFISRLWGGRASDRTITMESRIITKITPGMVIMADKGCTIEDLLPENIHLNMPPKTPQARPMTEN